MIIRDDNGLELDKNDVLEYIKNRPPLLMIENALIYPGVKGTSIKILANEDWYFSCHFPGDPLFPGVLQLESMFNLAALTIKTMDDLKKETTNISRLSNVSFLAPIRPEESIKVYVEVTKPYKRGVAHFLGTISSEYKVLCNAEFVLSIPRKMVIV